MSAPSSVSTILFLAANPADTSQLRLDQESRAIVQSLRGASRRHAFRIEQRWAATAADLRQALLDLRPRFVHFCGHGARTGIALEGPGGKATLVSGEALAGLFAVFTPQVECVILNACYSAAQAKAINRHVRCVVGMKVPISDRAAIEFATAFYDGIGAGLDLARAFDLGKNALALAGGAEVKTPVLLLNPAIPAPPPPRSPAKKTPRRPARQASGAPAASSTRVASRGSGAINQGAGTIIINHGSGAIASGDHAAAAGAGGIVVYGQKLRAAADALSPAARARLARAGLKLIRGAGR